MRRYFYIARRCADWGQVARAAVVGADAHGDPLGRGAARCNLGTFHWCAGEHQRAIEEFSAALPFTREAGWVSGETQALANVGLIYKETGRLAAARDSLTAALVVHRAHDQIMETASTLQNL